VLLSVAPAAAIVMQPCAAQQASVNAARNFYNAASNAVAYDLANNIGGNQLARDTATMGAAAAGLALANQSLVTCQSGG
jgi:hypothetical protein